MDLTVVRLKEILTERLQRFIERPEVTVIVKESQSKYVYTIGKIGQSGSYPLTPGMTVLQALSKAGGFAEWADTKNILVIRKSEEKEIRYRFNYNEYVAGKNLEQNIVLKPDDMIIVP